jgi:hypothetical protein
MNDTPHKRKVMAKALLRIFPKRAARFTVKNVIWWLEKLNVDGDSVAVPALCTEDVDLTDSEVFNANIMRIWELKRELIMGCKAQDVEARWMGGPPTAIKRYTGSFAQLLMDRIMMDVNCYGTANFVRINREWRAELEANNVQLYPLPKTLRARALSATTTTDELTVYSTDVSCPFEGTTAEWAR